METKNIGLANIISYDLEDRQEMKDYPELYIDELKDIKKGIKIERFSTWYKRVQPDRKGEK